MMIVGDIAVKFLPIWSRPLNHRNDKALGKFIPDEFVMACGCQRMTARCVATSPRPMELELVSCISMYPTNISHSANERILAFRK